MRNGETLVYVSNKSERTGTAATERSFWIMTGPASPPGNRDLTGSDKVMFASDCPIPTLVAAWSRSRICRLKTKNVGERFKGGKRSEASQLRWGEGEPCPWISTVLSGAR